MQSVASSLFPASDPAARAADGGTASLAVSGNLFGLLLMSALFSLAAARQRSASQ